MGWDVCYTVVALLSRAARCQHEVAVLNVTRSTFSYLQSLPAPIHSWMTISSVAFYHRSMPPVSHTSILQNVIDGVIDQCVAFTGNTYCVIRDSTLNTSQQNMVLVSGHDLLRFESTCQIRSRQCLRHQCCSVPSFERMTRRTASSRDNKTSNVPSNNTRLHSLYDTHPNTCPHRHSPHHR